MPSAQIIDLNPEGETSLQKTLSSFSNRMRQNQLEKQENDALKEIYSQYQQDGQNLERTIQAIQTRQGISPTTKVNTINQLLQFQKHNQQLQRQAAKSIKSMSPEDREIRKQRLMKERFSENEAEEYLDSPPGVQQIMWREHSDLKSRGLIKNQNENIPNTVQQPNVVRGQPLNNGEELGIEDSFSNESQEIDENSWPDIPPPPKMTPAEEIKWGNQNQKENNKLLAETRQKTNAIRSSGIRLNRLATLSEKVPDGAGRLVINPETGEPYHAAILLKAGVSKETQDYVKTLNDFLIDAKSYFGSRVTNFDVQSFKSRLPSLLNTADGRRLIIKQMQLMNDLEGLHATTLEDGLKNYGRNASYSDILSEVDQKTTSKETEIIQKINDLDTASTYMDLMARNPSKFENTVLMQRSADGKFKAMPKEKVNQAIKSKKWRIY